MAASSSTTNTLTGAGPGAGFGVWAGTGDADNSFRLVGAVQSGPRDQLGEVPWAAPVDDFLKRDEVGGQSVQLLVDQAQTPGVTLVVLDVDRDDP
ncbi:hypothetical protein [Streptomyces sp. KN37]|uniref:hypothetical protein n=1 Tax=Streptomyces sp. KN37 TaxID=3090667 RepID=UPI002A74F220|nr:hypothetical protein [Streptomyces sp. KN37]WPO69236.1 hypothetical protein R9806_00585 [Streptomyces sp. KN37]